MSIPVTRPALTSPRPRQAVGSKRGAAAVRSCSAQSGLTRIAVASVARSSADLKVGQCTNLKLAMRSRVMDRLLAAATRTWHSGAHPASAGALGVTQLDGYAGGRPGSLMYCGPAARQRPWARLVAPRQSRAERTRVGSPRTRAAVYCRTCGTWRPRQAQREQMYGIAH
jgi:hypothetical protein